MQLVSCGSQSRRTSFYCDLMWCSVARWSECWTCCWVGEGLRVRVIWLGNYINVKILLLFCLSTPFVESALDVGVHIRLEASVAIIASIVVLKSVVQILDVWFLCCYILIVLLYFPDPFQSFDLYVAV